MEFIAHQQTFESVYSSSPLLSAIRRGEFDEHGLVYKSPLHKLVWWWTFENIFALLSLRSEDRMLNVGIGFGFDEKVIKARLPGISLYGIDISHSMITGALLNSTPSALAVATAEKLPLPGNAFTRIVSREVIEHVLDPNLFLRQIREVATPGAVVVITTPNGDSLALQHLLHKLGLGSKPVYKDEHMTCGQLEQLFASCGFEIRERFFDCAGYFWLSWLFSTPLRSLALVLARAIRPLEGHDSLSRTMCDQVKYTLICQKTSQDLVLQETTKVGWVCPECKGPLLAAEVTLNCSWCGAIYSLIDGKAPVLLADSVTTAAARQNEVVTGEDMLLRQLAWLLRQLAWVIYSLVYGPTLLLAAVIAWLLERLGRSPKPLWA